MYLGAEIIMNGQSKQSQPEKGESSISPQIKALIQTEVREQLDRERAIFARGWRHWL